MCDVNGSAVVLVSGVWEQADPEIHISPQLLEDDAARGLLEQKYALGDWCEERHAFHAALAPAPALWPDRSEV